MLYEIISIIIGLLWILFLFKLGQNKKFKIWFYVLVSLPYAVSLIFFMSLSVLINFWEIFSLFGVIIILILITERIAWATTLRECSGKGELVWFFIIYLIPFIGWFLYRITKVA